LPASPYALGVWQREYDFRDTYGLAAFDAHSLKRLQGLLRDDARLRSAYERYYVSGGEHAITDADYPAYACGAIAMEVPSFAVCWRPVHRPARRAASAATGERGPAGVDHVQAQTSEGGSG
jgi:hypothetical protein